MSISTADELEQQLSVNRQNLETAQALTTQLESALAYASGVLMRVTSGELEDKPEFEFLRTVIEANRPVLESMYPVAQALESEIALLEKRIPEQREAEKRAQFFVQLSRNQSLN